MAVFIPKYAFDPVITEPAATLTPSAVSGNITLTASAPTFTVDHINQFVSGNFGRARIVGFTSTTVVKAITVVPFFDTSATNEWKLETGYEDAWSDARGWPRAVIFFQDRLVFAGTRSLPNALWLSRIGDYYNFDPAQALDDDAIFVFIRADDVPAIYQMKVDRHLQLFTSSAEYYVDVTGPVTPRNISVRRTTARGISRNLRPVNVSGATIFGERNGKTIREFLFSDTEAAYLAGNLSLVSAHLIKTPVDMALRKPTATDDSDLVMVVNSDGTMAALVTMRDQEFVAWVPWTTQGNFLNAGAVGELAYVVVERVIGFITRRYLEIFDADLLFDAAVEFGAVGPALTGLDHLTGESVRVRGDDANLGNETVIAGAITADRAFVTSGQVGLFFNPQAISLPAVYEDERGLRMDGKKRISRVMLDLYRTQNVQVNGSEVALRRFGEYVLGDPPPIVTGKKVVDGILGWGIDNQVTIAQAEPGPLTVRAMEYQLRG